MAPGSRKRSNSVNQTPPPPPKKQRKSPRKRFGPFGPYTAADRTLDGLSRVDATKLNEKRLKAALYEIAKGTYKPSDHRRTGHAMTRPQLAVGDKNRLDAGRYFEVCLEKSLPSCSFSQFATERIDQSILFDSDIPGTYFHIRAELEESDNGYSTPQNLLPEIHPFPALSPLRSSPSPPPVPSTSQVQVSPDATRVNSDIIFDKAFPVTLLAWIKDNQPYIESIIYPREDGRVRLSDFKLILGEKGIEQMNPIEIYHFDYARWIPALWKTPHFVPQRGHTLLLRYADVTWMADFTENLPFVAPPHSHDLPTPPTVSRKGKERAV